MKPKHATLIRWEDEDWQKVQRAIKKANHNLPQSGRYNQSKFIRLSVMTIVNRILSKTKKAAQ